jgi:hypothetical protein
LLADEPRNAGLRREQAKDLLRSGAPDLALLCLDAADPAATAVEDRALRAEARFALGQHVDAAREYEAAAADPAAAALAGELWMRASRAWERAGERGAATQAMERALADVDLSERERSALSRLRAFELGKIESVEDARAVLRLHDQAELRLTAARFLASADFAEAIATFGAASTDPDAGVRRVCMRALAERCGPLERSYVAARAAERLHDADVEVRIAALDALAVAGSRGEIPLLLEALDPEDRAQFRAARRALEAVSGHAEAGSLDPPPEERARLQKAWRAWWRNQGGT